MLSANAKKQIDQEITKYPEDRKKSAVMAALTIAQNEHDWLPQEVMDEIADYLGLRPIEVYEVASFYSMYELKPVGKHKICLCTNISCMLRGSSEIADYLKENLSITFGQTTEDGMFTLKEVECLAACVGAPMMQIGNDYYEDLTLDKLDDIINELRGQA